jgi:ABC-2 type transport system permease protein
MLQRDIMADMKSLRLTLVRLLLQPAVYIFVFGYVVGGMLPSKGVSYPEVMAPGIIAISVMTGPFVTVGGSIISGYYFRTIEAWLLAPVSLRSIMLAKVTSGLLYGLGSGSIVGILVWLILGIAPASIFLSLCMAAVGSLFFSLLIMVILLFPQRPDKGQELFSFLLMPMTFFGCTFYSYSMLRPPFSYLALLLPTTYISEGMRAAYNPRMEHMDSALIITGLFVTTLLLIPLADWVFRRRLRDFLW